MKGYYMSLNRQEKLILYGYGFKFRKIRTGAVPVLRILAIKKFIHVQEHGNQVIWRVTLRGYLLAILLRLKFMRV